MLKKIGLVMVVGLVLFLGYVAKQPANYVIMRETTIHAPVEKIFPYLNNSKLASTWSPWAEMDPKAKMSFSGPDAGIGSRTSWEEGEKLGTGSATIVGSMENQRVMIRLEYVKPFQMVQDADYAIRSIDSQQSVVTWSVRGRNKFSGRLMCVFMNMDKMVGGIFEKGLSNLKTLMEKQTP